jgi:hypothetical protein
VADEMTGRAEVGSAAKYFSEYFRIQHP